MLNAGVFRHRIAIYSITEGKDSQGFKQITRTKVLEPYAAIKTTKGFTLFINNSDFDKALTRFTIRYPQNTTITRDMQIDYKGKTYTILYLNNVDEMNVELEIQAKEVTH